MTGTQETTQPTVLDSKLMQDTLRAARTLVTMYETKAGTIADDELKDELQAMIDNKVVSLFYGAVTFITQLIEAGLLTPPEHAQRAEKSPIIVPPGFH